MDMISNFDKSLSAFEQNWRKYTEAILHYSSTAPVKTNELKLALKCLHEDGESDDNDDDDMLGK